MKTKPYIQFGYWAKKINFVELKYNMRFLKRLKNMKNSALYLTFGIIFAGILFNGCHGEDPKKDALSDSSSQFHYDAGKVVKFNGRLFSVPSPVQVASLIKASSMSYNKELLNPISKKDSYTGTFKQSLNLGVYGTDLGYINMYDQLSDAGGYFAVIKILSENLNIMNSFNEKTMKRIEKNSENKDSLLSIMTSVYRDADSYLIDNERNDIAILILTGGWVESLFIMTSSLSEKPDQRIIDRIGEQKHPLDNMIELMRPYYGKQSEEYDKLLEKLVDLATVFDGVVTEYKFSKPIINKEKKITLVKSNSKTIITDFQLKTISKMTEELRAEIVK
jgi:hypothetical protein